MENFWPQIRIQTSNTHTDLSAHQSQIFTSVCSSASEVLNFQTSEIHIIYVYVLTISSKLSNIIPLKVLKLVFLMCIAGNITITNVIIQNMTPMMPNSQQQAKWEKWFE